MKAIGRGSENSLSAAALLSFGGGAPRSLSPHGSHVDKILKGAPRRELPVERAAKFELVLNRKTAKALGLTIPPTLLARADEVIE